MSNSVIVSNLPQTCNGYVVSGLFADIGPIKRSFLIKNGLKEFTGSAQVTFVSSEDAIKAVDNFNNHEVDNQKIKVALISKEPERDTSKDTKGPSKKKRAKPDDELKTAGLDSAAGVPDETELPSKKQKLLNQTAQPLTNEVKSSYHQKQVGRLIVRNIPFKATEQDVKRFFEECGKITEVNFPKRKSGEDKNKKGCVFVQFMSQQEAENAIKGKNLQKFMGRPIAVDHAVPKGKYNPSVQPIKVEIKQEDENPITVPDDGRPLTSSERPSVEDSSDFVSVEHIKKEESDWESEQDEDQQSDTDTRSKRKRSRRIKNESSRGIKDEVPVKRESGDEESDKEGGRPRVRPDPSMHRPVSRDVTEGRTLFLSRLAIDTTAFSVETMLSKFGELKYVMLVTDKLTEQSKGTAFAQFKTTEAAEACLAAAEDPSKTAKLTVDGRVLCVRKAFGRGEAQSMQQGQQAMKPTKGKDNRNLYLAKEGFIREGTQAANGMSSSDMILRKQREQVKEKLLKNLHMFVSPERLCVNNLPPTMKEPQLRQLFKQHAPPTAKIIEARIMRYLSELDNTGAARSRGYGFVAFTRHCDALAALRAINNNPSIFTPFRRPIVEFSIENLAILNIKKKRMLKSRENLKSGKNTRTDVTTNGVKRTVSSKLPAGDASVASTERPSFSGFTSKKGDIKTGQGAKIHKHLGPKIRRRNLYKGKVDAKGSAKNNFRKKLVNKQKGIPMKKGRKAKGGSSQKHPSFKKSATKK